VHDRGILGLIDERRELDAIPLRQERAWEHEAVPRGSEEGFEGLVRVVELAACGAPEPRRDALQQLRRRPSQQRLVPGPVINADRRGAALRHELLVRCVGEIFP
jgi:hypothetical protein